MSRSIVLMRQEWAYGRDIGDPDVLLEVGTAIGLDADELAATTEDPARLDQLQRNWSEAEEKGAIGMPTFVIDDQIFWGQDRIEFVLEHLHELRLRKL